MRLHSTAFTALSGLVFTASFANVSLAQDYEGLRKAINDRVSDSWIYEDIEKGYAEARKTGSNRSGGVIDVLSARVTQEE